ncbi:MAG TPA: cytochrome c [Gammaproteobacteria bacterium]
MVLIARLAALCVTLAVVSGRLPADEPARGESAGGLEASIWDGVFTDAQARRGRELYPGPCGKCHGKRLDGAPDDPDMFSTKPIGGPKFLRNWDGRSLGVLFEYLRTTMPANNPGFLSDGEYADLLAYMLAVSGAPPGEVELPPDPSALAAVAIRKAPD